MRIVITSWGLDSYLELLHKGLFDRPLYWEILRPDILRLRDMTTDIKFQNPKFWGPAEDRQGRSVKDGFKMKWHNFGNGSVQLRLCIGLVGDDAYLCHAFIKTDAALDHRMAAKLKDRIVLIREGKHVEVGELP